MANPRKIGSPHPSGRFGRIYQQTFVDTYSKWAAAKRYTTKTPITSADLLNDKLLPAFAKQGMSVIRILTDRGTEYCGKPETHDYQLYLALNDIEHTKTKAFHPQTNSICERFHKTILDEFYRVTFRRTSCTPRLRCYRPIWMTGFDTTTITEHIRARCVSDEHR